MEVSVIVTVPEIPLRRVWVNVRENSGGPDGSWGVLFFSSRLWDRGRLPGHGLPFAFTFYKGAGVVVI